MTFEKWITEWCECVEFEDTEQYFHDLVLDNLNMGDDMFDYMQEAFAAGVRSREENGAMTKLEELKMAYDAANAAYDAADDDCYDAVDAHDAAWDAYYDELKRVQEEHYNDY